MKKYISIFLIAFAFLMLTTSQAGLLFANEDNEQVEPTKLQSINVEIDNFEQYTFCDSYSTEILLTSNSSIARFDSSIPESIETLQISTLQTGIFEPKFAIKISKDNIIVCDSLKRIQLFDEEYNLKKSFNVVYVNEHSAYNLENVTSISKDFFGQLYMLDLVNQKLLTLDISNQYIQELDFDYNLNFDENSKIAVNPNGNLIAVLCQASVYVFDFEQNQQICEIENIIAKDVKFDYMNNLFLIDDNQISKYEHEDYVFESSEEIDKNIKSTSINIETGEFYLLSDNIYSFFTEGFSANAQEEIAPVSISTTTALESNVIVAKTTQNTELFATCVSTNKKFEIAENTTVIVLKQDIFQNQNVCYCLVNFNGNEEFGFVQKDDLQILSVVNLSQNFVTVCTNVKVRTYPSQNAGVCKIISNENTNVVVLNNLNGYTDFAANKYFAIQLENGVGYVDETYLAELGTFESIMIDVEPTPTHKQEFVAYSLVVAMLLLLTVFVCVWAIKKKK